MQRPGQFAFRQRRVGGIGRSQCRFGFDRDERIEARLPLGNAVETGLRRLA